MHTAIVFAAAYAALVLLHEREALLPVFRPEIYRPALGAHAVVMAAFFACSSALLGGDARDILVVAWLGLGAGWLLYSLFCGSLPTEHRELY